MKLPYGFNRKYDPLDYEWKMSAEETIADFVTYDKESSYRFLERRGIEAQVSKLVEVIGGLSDTLISKGLMTPEQFLEAIGADRIYEVRENKF